ncbi:MAG: protein-disulfide reductase DsbD family protein, partial [Gammaproteobacteria bacterium]|nr:protein-disulfide reductase DsbD family protein [Gammaproteobacteria bacterium]
MLAIYFAFFTAFAAAEPEALVRTAQTPRVSATFAPALEVAVPGTEVPVVLHQRIAEGWHTYWENPGDSGERIAIDWRLPDGVSAGELRYPVPEAIAVGPLMNYGYSGEAAVLTKIAIPEDWPAGRSVPLEAHATWLVCKEICIPEEARFAITLPTGGEPAELESASGLFARAQAAMPEPVRWPLSISDQGETLVLRLEAELDPSSVEGAYFYPRHWGHLDHAAKQTARTADGGFEIVLSKGEIPLADRLDGILALGGATPVGYLISAPVSAAPPASASSSGTLLTLA